MDHYQKIYAQKAREYQRMIAVEDVDQNLQAALTEIVGWEEKTILDLGSGTGRFPILFKDKHSKFIGLDLSHAMLLESAALQPQHQVHWALVQADMRHLPVCSQCAEIVIAGWAIGHLRSWFDPWWKLEVARILEEMQRAVKPHGTLIICETFGTGSQAAGPPSQDLAEYYDWLESEWQFSRKVISTDYQFEDVDQAVSYTEFFFGSALAEMIRKNGWSRLPEWTGIWSKHI
jgi:ubiquinone/menaquinone biosynthesis C-methylase UbiE